VRIWLLIVLLIPQLAMARVYMCVDEETGKASFTDKACDTAETREEVMVGRANMESGRSYGSKPSRKVWNSQVDTRKSGIDYNNERRSGYGESATAAAE